MQTFKIAAITAAVVFMQATSLTWYFSLVSKGNFAQAFPVPNPVTLAEAYQIVDIDSEIIGSVLSPKEIYISDQQVSFSKQDFDCLARNIYYEAGIESSAGRVAVAQVTHNRLKSGRWGRSICSVVYAASQFSWTLDPNKRSARPYGPLWRASLQSVRDYMAGQRVYGLDRSQHYHADYVSPVWGRDEHKIKQIGRHIFYDLGGPVNVAEIQHQ